MNKGCEKMQYKHLMSNLHEMLRSLGVEGQSKLLIKMDEFECYRRNFIEAATIFEKANTELPYTSDKKERGILVYKVSSNRAVMDKSLREMVQHTKKMSDKFRQKNHKKIKDADIVRMETELQYKNLTVYNLQKHYFKLVKSEDKEISRPNRHYPDAKTLEELLVNKPEKRGFSEETDPESEEYLKEKEILDAIKSIDDRIEEKMDYILQGLQMLNYNALSIKEGIDEVQKKILINVEQLDLNMVELQDATDLIDEASKHTSKPNCIMNVIIIILIAIMVYLVVRKLIPEAADDPNAIVK